LLTRWSRRPTTEASSSGCSRLPRLRRRGRRLLSGDEAGGRASLRSYGRFVGKRFKDLPNIVWVMGGDFTPKKDDQWTVTEGAEGIREEDSMHLMTGHGSPEHSAVAAFGEQNWLTVNSVYSYEKTLFRAGPGRAPTQPDPPLRSHRVHLRR